ncbi:hypothetical protein WJ63_29740 [Burkholderia pyrrocinia]|nr:hypothetical protein WJ63_29740 [Burkholderia pyrrocinia]
MHVFLPINVRHFNLRLNKVFKPLNCARIFFVFNSSSLFLHQKLANHPRNCAFIKLTRIDMFHARKSECEEKTPNFDALNSLHLIVTRQLHRYKALLDDFRALRSQDFIITRKCFACLLPLLLYLLHLRVLVR